MSDSRSRSSSGGSGFGLVGLVGAIVAFCSNPTFTGWVGVGKSILVGSGTSMGGGIVALPCALAGAGIGGIFGAVAGGRRAAGVGAIGGALLCGLPGAGYGIYKGYSLSEEWLTATAQVAPAEQANAGQPTLSGDTLTLGR